MFSILLIISFGRALCLLPFPNSSSDPVVVKHLEKMWEGYNKAVLFRKEQLPAMEYRDQAIVFNDRTFEDHIIDFDAILVEFLVSQELKSNPSSFYNPSKCCDKKSMFTKNDS